MRIAWLRGGHRDAETDAAERWARGRGWALHALRAGSATREAAHELARADVIWCHAGLQVPELDATVGAMVAGAVRRGARAVLSLLATPLAETLGAPGPAPLVEAARRWRHDDDPRWPPAFHDWPGYPHIRGFQGWGDHPLFTGMQRGAFTWMAREGDQVARATFARPEWPRGRVIAVDRSYVHLDADTAVAWEFDVGAGRVLCLGANVYFNAGDPLLHLQRDSVMENALRDASTSPRSSLPPWAWWPDAEERHASVAPVPRPRALLHARSVPDLQPRVSGVPAGETPFSLGVAGGLAVGSLAGGVRELWLHPLCVIDGGVRVATESGDLECVDATVSPGHMERRLRAPDGSEWRELIAGSVDEPEFHYSLEPAGQRAAGASVAVEFGIPLRLEWPMPADALQPLRAEVRQQDGRAAMVITGRDGRHVVAVYVDGAAELHQRDSASSPALTVVSAPGGSVRIAWRSSVEGASSLAPRTGGVGPALDAQAARLPALRARTTRLTTGRVELDEAWEWAIARLANFVVAAPGGGRGLMAGYASTRPGWNVSRPGYAWFFGRDACWSIDALLAAGMFEEAHDAIDLLARTADVTGKVIHELTTSGVAHYDAADSTPLFLRAVAAYAEWSGDRRAVRAWWPAVTRAFDFVRSCDRDADGLPENTGIGHGWVEMGPLGGGAVTSYVAAIWIQALQRLVPVAVDLGEEGLATRLVAALGAARTGLEALRLPDGRLALHRDATGELAPDLTALDAVPIALGVDASSHAVAVMHGLADARFTTPWGLRMLPIDDRRYDPAAYHAGSVWPLFTGWAALADCAVGNVDRALARVASISTGALQAGAFAEVLRGDTGGRAGVCADQAWSAAMVIAPVVSGVAAVRPNAFASRVAVGTALPAQLETMSLGQLRVGETRLACRWQRSGDGVEVSVSHTGGPPIDVELQGAPGGARVLAARDDVCVTIPRRLVREQA